MHTTAKRRSGRPRKPESEKVQYQRIAVYAEDYQLFVEEIGRRGVQLTDAFADMVKRYVK